MNGAPAPGITPIGPPCVLVVDDHPLNLELARCVLEADGCEVDTVSSGEQALRWVERRRPEVMLVDIQMPVLDGFELTRLLRADAGTRDICLIAFTAYAMAGDEQRFLAAGFDGYIAKPIDVGTFAAQLRSLLEARRKGLDG